MKMRVLMEKRAYVIYNLSDLCRSMLKSRLFIEIVVSDQRVKKMDKRNRSKIAED